MLTIEQKLRSAIQQFRPDHDTDELVAHVKQSVTASHVMQGHSWDESAGLLTQNAFGMLLHPALAKADAAEILREDV